MLVSIVGLAFTFREARRARTAAEGASAQVARVVSMTRARARLAALASAVSSTDVVRLRIDKDALRDSGEAFTAFRRSVLEALSVMAALGDELCPSQVVDIESRLVEIGQLIDSDIDVRRRRTKMRSALEVIAVFLIRQEARVKTEDVT